MPRGVGNVVVLVLDHIGIVLQKKMLDTDVENTPQYPTGGAIVRIWRQLCSPWEMGGPHRTRICPVVGGTLVFWFWTKSGSSRTKTTRNWFLKRAVGPRGR